MLDKLLAIIDGKKTYVGAAGFLILALYHFRNGEHEQATQYFLAALTIVGLRHAVDKSVPPVTK